MHEFHIYNMLQTYSKLVYRPAFLLISTINYDVEYNFFCDIDEFEHGLLKMLSYL